MTKLYFTRLSICFVFILCACAAYGQQKVEIIDAEEFLYIKKDGRQVAKFRGHVAFKQGNMILRCDSALKYEESNEVEAMGNVVITQGDTMTLTGKRVLYNGNTKKARVTGGVNLSDRDMMLTTEEVDYDVNSKTAYYTTGGTIINKNNKLTSRTGSYNGFSKDLYFRGNVQLHNPEYDMQSDTLRYHMPSRVAYFFGPTTITSEDNTIYCEYGWYDTENERSQFSKKAWIVSKENTIKADSMLYFRRQGIGRAYNNILISDTVEKMTIAGNYGEYNRFRHTALVTKKALATKLIDEDSLYLGADSFFYRYDTTSEVRNIYAYHKVKIFKSDLQGVCDSLYYTSSDTTFFMFNDPVLWSEANQLTGDTVRVDMKGNRVNFIDMLNNAFIASKEDSSKFNQIRGKNMRGWFAGNSLYKVDVAGNGQSIYYAREDSGTYSGVNVISCSDMVIYIDSNHVKSIVFINEPEGTFYPPEQFGIAESRLKGFRWLEARRPRGKRDLVEQSQAVQPHPPVADPLRRETLQGEPNSSPKERGNEKRTFTGTAMMSSGKALFIYDLADSAAFSLEGLSKWDKKYLGKKLTVEGMLVQDEKGSVIKGWKITKVENK